MRRDFLRAASSACRPLLVNLLGPLAKGQAMTSEAKSSTGLISRRHVWLLTGSKTTKRGASPRWQSTPAQRQRADRRKRRGAEGRGGASIALANPAYLSIVDEATMRKIVANGVRGTSMPAFAQRAGGMLTEDQITVIVGGIYSRWGRKGVLDGANPPSYAAETAGNVDHGRLVFGTYCVTCHGPEGGGTRKGSAITNDSFLALVSDQELRTIVITGRPELGAPDWRSNVPGHPMSDQEITDVVAWLASRRAQNPGQPYSAVNYAQHSEK